jgi:hypothetical protein
MKVYRHSCKKFNSLDDLNFCPKDYSKFKHGSKTIARKFGKELAKSFINWFDFSLIDKDIVICSAPYKFIPVASNTLKDYFLSKFNPFIVKTFNSPIDLKVFRGHSYNDDYGNATLEERSILISSDDFYIDSEIIKDKCLIFIDDIRITGSHENRIHSLLKSINFDGTVIYLYYAELDNYSSIHPNIENELNYAFVKNILDINFIIHNEDFIFNTRVVKYILKQPKETFETFISYQSDVFKETLLSNACGNGYHSIDGFKENVSFLTKLTYL